MKKKRRRGGSEKKDNNWLGGGKEEKETLEHLKISKFTECRNRGVGGELQQH